MNVINTTVPPSEASTKVASFKPDLLQSPDHHLCGGCGHPVALRVILEALQELDLVKRNILLLSHGCSGTLADRIDIDLTL